MIPRIRDLYQRLVCSITGHKYPYVMHGCALYFCQRGCGREFLRGYMTTAEYERAMAELPPITDELREQDELMDYLEAESE